MNLKWIFQQKINNGSKINIIMFTYAGGNASTFAPWKRYIPSDFSMYPVLYPGRGKRISEPCCIDLKELVKSFVNENQDLFKEKFVLLGHCTGTVLAYETYKYVKNFMQRIPEGFIVSCGASPDSRLFDADISAMSNEEFISLLIDTGRIDAESAKLENFKEYYLPILKNDFIMMENYKCGEVDKIQCPVDIIIADKDELVKPEQIYKWQDFSSEDIKITTVSGGHYYLEKDTANVCKLINNIVYKYI